MRTASPDPSATPAGGDPAGALSRGEPERLGALLQALQPRLRAVALRYTRDAEAARDVVQNAFEKAIRHRHQFRGGARPSTWMHRIVINEALMWLRKERRHGQRLVSAEDLEGLAVEDRDESALERIERRDDAGRVRRALAGLDPEERQVIERCALQGISYRRFAAEAGLHPSAAKSRAFRARRRLGELLAAGAPARGPLARAASPRRTELR